MAARACTVVRTATVIALLLIAAPARAQPEGEAGAVRREDPPTSVDILIGTAAILQSVDIFTTAYTLQLGGNGAREANPFLAPFEGRPVALASVSGAIGVLQAYTVTKLQRRHPKIALAWALILVGLETYAVTNNVHFAGQLQRARAGRR